jgi:hypothetical protein
MLDFLGHVVPALQGGNSRAQTLYSELQPRGLEIIGLSVDEGPAVKVATLVQKFELPYRFALADESVMMTMRHSRHPHQVHCGPLGLVRKHYQGMVPESQFARGYRGVAGGGEAQEKREK